MYRKAVFQSRNSPLPTLPTAETEYLKRLDNPKGEHLPEENWNILIPSMGMLYLPT